MFLMYKEINVNELLNQDEFKVMEVIATGVEWEILRTNLDADDESLYIVTIGEDDFSKVEFSYWYTPIIPEAVDNSQYAKVIGGLLVTSLIIIGLIKLFDLCYKYWKDRRKNKEEDI